MPAELKSGGQLSRAAIVASAIEMIEEEGVESLSIRKLARRCGAAPMSLYRHIATKQELLRAVADVYLAEVQYPATDELSWDESIKRVILALDEGFESHPRLAEIMSVQPVDAAAVLAAMELCASALRRGGLGDDEVVSGLAVLTAYATGYVQRRAERRRDAAIQEERLRRIQHLDEAEFPTLTSLGDALTTLDTREYFEAGLDILIDALRRRASASPA